MPPVSRDRCSPDKHYKARFFFCFFPEKTLQDHSPDLPANYMCRYTVYCSLRNNNDNTNSDSNNDYRDNNNKFYRRILNPVPAQYTQT